MATRLIILVSLCAVAITSMAQSVITGKVSNAGGSCVDFVSVIASPTNAPKTILASAFTDENGKFQMSVKSECDSLILKASGIEIATAQITVPNRTGNYEIQPLAQRYVQQCISRRQIGRVRYQRCLSERPDARQSHSAITNYLPDGGVNTIDEMMSGTASMQKAYGDFTYLNNCDENYLKEQLKFDWSATDADSRILAGGDNIGQIGKTTTYRLLNK